MLFFMITRIIIIISVVEHSLLQQHIVNLNGEGGVSRIVELEVFSIFFFLSLLLMNCNSYTLSVLR